MKRFGKYFLGLFFLAITILFFQNCADGYKSMDGVEDNLNSQSETNNDNQDSIIGDEVNDEEDTNNNNGNSSSIEFTNADSFAFFQDKDSDFTIPVAFNKNLPADGQLSIRFTGSSIDDQWIADFYENRQLSLEVSSGTLGINIDLPKPLGRALKTRVTTQLSLVLKMGEEEIIKKINVSIEPKETQITKVWKAYTDRSKKKFEHIGKDALGQYYRIADFSSNGITKFSSRIKMINEDSQYVWYVKEIEPNLYGIFDDKLGANPLRTTDKEIVQFTGYYNGAVALFKGRDEFIQVGYKDYDKNADELLNKNPPVKSKRGKIKQITQAYSPYWLFILYDSGLLSSNIVSKSQGLNEKKTFNFNSEVKSMCGSHYGLFVLLENNKIMFIEDDKDPIEVDFAKLLPSAVKEANVTRIDAAGPILNIYFEVGEMEINARYQTKYESKDSQFSLNLLKTYSTNLLSIFNKTSGGPTDFNPILN